MAVPSSAMLASRTVAVIGAGAAGLAAARELQREGHTPTIFEQGPTVGGVWMLDPATESDPLGQDPRRRKVHSSMYVHLRTNLPREVMGYSDLPFHPRAMELVAQGLRSGSAQPIQAPWAPPPEPAEPDYAECRSVDSRRYCSHEEVLRYLRAYALFHDLPRLVQFNTEVLEVAPEEKPTASAEVAAGRDPAGMPAPSLAPFAWRITTRHPQRGLQHHTFDAVVVANGHYSHPLVPDIPGMGAFPRPRQVHSHNYRVPEPFAGQVVLVVGASNSGEDISRELSGVARRVLLAARGWRPEQLSQAPHGAGSDIHRVPIPECLTAESTAVFPGGREEQVDSIIYATGYRYEFPMFTGEQVSCQQGTELAGLGGVRTHMRYVSPLFLHLFPASPLAPWCALVGIPWKTVPFPQMQVQARLVARALSGKVSLPSPEAMREHEEQRVRRMLDEGTPLRYLHNQHITQFAYNRELEALSGADVEPLPAWREEMYAMSGGIRRRHTDVYRDAAWAETDTLRRMEEHMAAQLDALELALAAQQQRYPAPARL